MVNKNFVIDDETFSIGEKWTNTSKDINNYIIKKNNKFISSLFYFGSVRNTFQVFGWDRLGKSKKKTFYLLIFNSISEEIRSSKIDFPSGKNFKAFCDSIIKKLNT